MRVDAIVEALTALRNLVTIAEDYPRTMRGNFLREVKREARRLEKEYKKEKE